MKKYASIHDQFDLRLEQYRNELKLKMDNFNPLDFDIMNKEYFFIERDKINQ